ncbi:NAD(P)-dependent alcohol dehydrogenase [Acidovorax lacteus]|uniref:NAD(P)-dependent alcohol dehydrogenase n=1 Tax=Acidovorax lacteus TaxID=1924988 RepID=A0ABP8L869_9BURK
MRAIVCTRYGAPDVLEWADLPTPEPAPHELRVRVLTTTVNSADWRVRARALPPGFGLLGRLALGWRGPRRPVLGSEFAGIVDAVGPAVRRFRVGDAVFGFSGGRMGCHAEYVCVAEHGPVAAIPQRLGLEHAAAMCFGGSTMLDFYRRARLGAGEHVLVLGASGTVGTAAVQLARILGARVTAACSAPRRALMHRLGAQQCIDPHAEPMAQQTERYDVVVDCHGGRGVVPLLQLLNPGGRLLLLTATLAELLAAPWLGRLQGLRVVAGPAEERADDVQELARLSALGLYTPVVGAVLPWSAFREAHARVEDGHKCGSLVLRVEPLDDATAPIHKQALPPNARPTRPDTAGNIAPAAPAEAHAPCTLPPTR